MEKEKRLIDANALKRQFIDYVRTPPHFHYGDWQNMCINGTEINEVIENAPTVDAVEVVHGRWVKIADICGIEVLKCSACGREHPRMRTAYCCDCGAKMDGGHENG